ncbi:MAG: porin family protein [Nitrospira sp.]|nr:porin family protein [Nitrospira sp.]MCP9463020.1 porin family protein [Nitrospira sp.]MCP9476129.1 porin family protein [Nitrospira sp.]
MRSVQQVILAVAGILGILILDGSLDARAEWYVAGYGGYSTGGDLNDVTMPLRGERLARQQFPQADEPLNSLGRGTLYQQFSTSDVSLKSSAMYGGKVGYFFDNLKLPWLGVEAEIFTTTPTIKAQTVDTSHQITYQPNTPATATQCADIAPPPNCPKSVSSRSTLSLGESDLRVITFALNLIARYPGSVIQPYVGVGVGGFYFIGSGQIDGRQFVPGLNAQFGLKYLATQHWALFAEGKYNLAHVSTLDQTFGISGLYSIFHVAAGAAYHF